MKDKQILTKTENQELASKTITHPVEIRPRKIELAELTQKGRIIMRRRFFKNLMKRELGTD